jgi:hypothetical protein
MMSLVLREVDQALSWKDGWSLVSILSSKFVV